MPWILTRREFSLTDNIAQILIGNENTFMDGLSLALCIASLKAIDQCMYFFRGKPHPRDKNHPTGVNLRSCHGQPAQHTPLFIAPGDHCQSRIILLGDRTANNSVDELVTLASLVGLDSILT